MGSLFSDILLFLKKSYISRRGIKRLVRFSEEEEKYIELLGRHFKDKLVSDNGISKDSETDSIITDINESDRLSSGVDEKLSELRDKYDMAKEEYEKSKELVLGEIAEIEFKLKELKDDIRPIIRERELSKKNIGVIYKKVKSLKGDKEKLLREVSNSNDSESYSGEDIATQAQAIEQEIYMLSSDLEEEEARIFELNGRIDPFEKELSSLSTDLEKIDKGWKIDEKEKLEVQERFIKLIRSAEEEKELIEARKVVPYIELGKSVINKSIENDDFLEAQKKLVEISKLKYALRLELLEAKNILKSKRLKKVKLFFILFNVFLILSIVLTLLIVY